MAVMRSNSFSSQNMVSATMVKTQIHKSVSDTSFHSNSTKAQSHFIYIMIDYQRYMHDGWL